MIRYDIEHMIRAKQYNLYNSHYLINVCKLVIYDENNVNFIIQGITEKKLYY